MNKGFYHLGNLEGEDEEDKRAEGDLPRRRQHPDKFWLRHPSIDEFIYRLGLAELIDQEVRVKTRAWGIRNRGSLVPLLRSLSANICFAA
jgi:hypothetical protein